MVCENLLRDLLMKSLLFCPSFHAYLAIDHLRQWITGDEEEEEEEEEKDFIDLEEGLENRH